MEKTAAACRGGGGGEDFFIQEILVWLPVVSLLRFKSVCKSWRALIQTSYFIHLHTTTTSNSSSFSKFGTFILQASGYQHGHYSMENAILMLSSESSSSSRSSSSSASSGPPEYGGGGGDWHWDVTNSGWHWVSDHEEDPDDDDDYYQHEVFKADDDQLLVLKLQNFGLPSCYMLCSGEIIAGSCNGLICLHDSYRKSVSLWNPATRQFRHLPKSTTTTTIEIENIGNFDFVGFGFDVKTKDYKVLLITYFTPPTFGHLEFLCRVQVYSLSTDSWSLLPAALPPMMAAGHHGLYLNGSYFFVGTKIIELPSNNKRLIPSNNRLMFSFDFTKQIFNTMQLPDHDYRQKLVLSCLGNKLALFTTTDSSLGLVVEHQSHKSSSYEDYDIWVWNEHGGACSSSSNSNSVNKESWTKFHSFRIKNKGLEYSIPRGISNNGEFAFIETRCYSGLKKKKMQLFNLITKEAKKDFLICDSVCKTDVYQQSLVSIIGGNDASTSSRSTSR